MQQEQLLELDSECKSTHNVRAKIERVLVNYVSVLFKGGRPVLEFPSKQADNVVEFGPRFQKRLKDKHVISKLGSKSVKKHSKVWLIMSYLYSNVLANRTRVTQRELYYSLVLFTSQRELNDRVLDIAGMLKVPRGLLGVEASARGFVTGPLSIVEHHSNMRYNCQHGPQLIISCFGEVSCDYKSNARFILLVEKEAVFQRLSEENFAAKVNCILVTGLGFPSVSCRSFVSRLSSTTNLQVYGLFDFNPHGLAILMSFAVGTAGIGIESYLYSVDVEWIGLFWEDITRLSIASPQLKGFNQSDRVMVKKLVQSHYISSNKSYRHQVRMMETHQVKAEIESLNQLEFDYLYREFLPGKLLKHRLKST